MTEESILRRIPPTDLVDGRALAHRAVQHLSRAARANIAAAPDDSHTSVAWAQGQGCFLSHPMGEKGALRVGLSLAPLALTVLQDGAVVAEIALANITDADAGAWLDEELGARSLKPSTPIDLPYDLPTEVAAVDAYAEGGEAVALTALGAWFSLAERLLTKVKADTASIDPGPSDVVCWPHHFDIATYVGLERGGSENAKGIGVGMSPGDESYAQPYFYINPWPHLDPKTLPAAPPPGHWHTEGFVGAIATGEEVLSLSDIDKGLLRFLAGAFDIGRSELGA